jgi:hypothetical protein
MRNKLAWVFLICATWVVHLIHVAMLAPPRNLKPENVNPSLAHWFPKEKAGINQLVLTGNSFERGYAAGLKTKALLAAEENKLFELFRTMVPNPIVRTGFVLGLMRWFWGLDRYFEPFVMDEMYGVSLSAPHEGDSYADPFTRQAAYHGLHEVGQMFVDVGWEGIGCTLFAVPRKNGWIIGRNFDFEGGRIFDDQKIMKWVFPSEGNAFISVIWAGMVGAVTGVNDHGVYISINAAGSTDFRRYGTPSTLVISKALQFAKTAEEARKMIEAATVFITDIYVVADAKSVLRIEKSPRKTRVLPIERAEVVTNHLIDDAWRDDRINIFRRDKLTSESRLERGEELLQKNLVRLSKLENIDSLVLSFMRDKSGMGGKRLHLGHRASIDGLIATHAVLYDGPRSTLYVSEGPALVGPFHGYDLRKSFAERKPIEVDELPADPEVSVAEFYKIKEALNEISVVDALVAKKACDRAEVVWKKVPFIEHSDYYIALGKLEACLGREDEAKLAFRHAMDLNPPYESQRRQIQERLK